MANLAELWINNIYGIINMIKKYRHHENIRVRKIKGDREEIKYAERF
ncbi:hypothetical protein [Clostridium magnum]|nr:hypothetical protein [Clostridium magnum]